jgi:hypothetical protein
MEDRTANYASGVSSRNCRSDFFIQGRFQASYVKPASFDYNQIHYFLQMLPTGKACLGGPYDQDAFVLGLR